MEYRIVSLKRIRDKIAASKQKGMWIGGLPPLGYDIVDKKLIVNRAEADVVEKLFRLYLELGSVRSLKREADRQELVTKRHRRDDRLTGGKPFSRGNLYQLLHNPLYAGEIAHKGKTHTGQHRAIIDRETWDAVQRLLAGNAKARRSDKNVMGTCLLTELVYDETGDRLCPTYAIKKGRRYRYYVSKRLVHAPDADGDGWRIPSGELENIVRRSICAFLEDEICLVEALPAITASLGQIRRLIQGASELVTKLAPHENRQELRHLIRRATLDQTAIRIEIPERNLLELLQCPSAEPPGSVDRVVHLEVPISLRRRGVEAKLVLRSADHRAHDRKLIALVARSHAWIEQLSGGAVGSIREIARHDHLDEADVSRFLPLAFLAPDIMGAIISGSGQAELTVETLRRLCPIPSSRESQRVLMGVDTNENLPAK